MSDADLPLVQAELKYLFPCTKCNLVCIIDAYDDDVSLELKEEFFRQEHDLEYWQDLPEGWEEAEVPVVPTIVSCASCGTRYKTNFYVEDDDNG